MKNYLLRALIPFTLAVIFTVIYFKSDHTPAPPPPILTDEQLYQKAKRELLEVLSSDFACPDAKQASSDALLRLTIAHGDVQVPVEFLIKKD